ncbi:hypothetical protein BW14_08585 [Bifidobacterium sp. UTBIF-68]|uniref:hypothetical protein n=1 Tax=Bifidobacterium sp. UTBIF-68 TaxID=1465262 RepID=UPI00112770AE|nr:hypothetical protein [Bifidobacterium sp. UTBIF-68]TPF92469.1 hypothetical protein BW14_08585 [Bifidobacterium sp. UTBIF-68]
MNGDDVHVDGLDAMLSDVGGSEPAAAPESSSPPPAALSAGALSGLLDGMYRSRHNGRSPSPALASMIERIVRETAGAPPREPGYGPGLWSDVPCIEADSMASARPLAWTADPSDGLVDLAMLHTIRYGEWLCRVFPDWEETLPSCWIRHDAVVQEVYALKCFADAIACDPSGGMQAPALMQHIRSALDRVRSYLADEHAEQETHGHHMDDPASRRRRDDRFMEYQSWFDRQAGWHGMDPVPGSWGAGPDFVAGVLLAYGAPPQPAAYEAPSPLGLRSGLEESQEALDGYRRRHDEISRLPAGDDRRSQEARLANDSSTSLAKLSRLWDDYRQAELQARDRLERAVAEGDRRLADRNRPVSPDTAERIRGLQRQADMLMADAGDPRLDRDSYRPADLAKETRMADSLEHLTHDEALDALERLSRLIPEIRDTIREA